MTTRIALTLACTLLAGTPAWSQSSDGRWAAGASTGFVMGVASDDSEARVIGAATIRRDLGRHRLIEVEVGRWGRSHTSSSGPAPITTVGVSGTQVSGQVDSVTTTDARTTWESAVNLFGRTTGRVSLFAGGGVGIGVTHSVYQVVLAGCVAPGNPDLCRNVDMRQDNAGLMLQGAAGADVSFSTHLTATVSVRLRQGYPLQPNTVGVNAGVLVRK